jgi:hypothetical protein
VTGAWTEQFRLNEVLNRRKILSWVGVILIHVGVPSELLSTCMFDEDGTHNQFIFFFLIYPYAIFRRRIILFYLWIP